jgi:hypothetical protein
MHEHYECEHEIKYCSKCDVCYCTKCHKEWIFYHPYVYPQTYPFTITYANGTQTYLTGDKIIDTTPVITCNHGG